MMKELNGMVQKAVMKILQMNTILAIKVVA
jgi:hypothetical protein